MAGINVYIADTEEEAERLFTSVIRMFVGILTGAREPLQPPTEMTEDLKDLLKHPALYQMLKYSFVGTKQTVKKGIKSFLEDTQVDELIVVSTTYAFEDRIKSIKLFAEVMTEISKGR